MDMIDKMNAADAYRVFERFTKRLSDMFSVIDAAINAEHKKELASSGK